MATYAQNLATARDNICARIAEITASPNPDVNIDGQSVSKGTYLTQLTGQLDQITKLLQTAGGPWEIKTRGVV